MTEEELDAIISGRGKAGAPPTGASTPSAPTPDPVAQKIEQQAPSYSLEQFSEGVTLDQGEERLLRESEAARQEQAAEVKMRAEAATDPTKEFPVDSNMYEGLTVDEARILYERLKASPRAVPPPEGSHPSASYGYRRLNQRTGQEEVVALPEPTSDAFNPLWSATNAILPESLQIVDERADVGLRSRAEGFADNLIKGVGEKVGAVGAEYGPEATEPMFNALYEASTKIPRYQFGGGEAFAADTAAFALGGAVGFGAGAKVANTFGKLLSKMGALNKAPAAVSAATEIAGRIGAGVAKLTGVAVGETAVMPSRESGVFLGMNPSAGGQYGADPFRTGEAKTDRELIARNVPNLLADSALISSAGVGASTVVNFLLNAAGTGVIRNVVRAASKNAQEEAIFDVVIDKLIAAADPKFTEDQRRQFMQDIANVIKENKSAVLEMADGKRLEYTRTLFDSVIASLDDAIPGEAALKQAARNLQQGILASGTSGRTLNVLGAPTRQLESTLAGAKAADGGAAIEDAARFFYDQNQAIVGTAKAQVDEAKAALDAAGGDIRAAIEAEPTLGKKVAALEEDMKKGLTGPAINTDSEAVTDRVVRLHEAMRTKQKALYDGIEPVAFDVPEFLGAVEKLRPEDIDFLGSTIGSKSPQIGSLLNALKRREAGGVTETVDEARARVASALAESGVTFREVFTELAPALAGQRDKLIKLGVAEKAMAGRLNTLVSYIRRDMVDQLAETSPEQARIAAEAIDFSRKYESFWNDGGVLEKVSDILRDPGERTALRRSNERADIAGKIRSTLGSGEAGRLASLQAASKMGTDFPPEVYEQGRDFLGSDAFLRGVTPVTDSVINASAREVADRALSAGGLDALTASDFLGQIEKSLVSIERFAPDEVASVRDLAARLPALIDNRDAAARTVKEMEEGLRRAQDSANRNELAAFMAKENTSGAAGPVTGADAYRAFAQTLDGRSADDVQRLAARAQENPRVLAGMKTAYAEWFRGKVLTQTTESTGQRALSTRVSSIVDTPEYNDVLTKGRIILGDDVMEQVEFFLSGARDAAQAKGAKPVAAFSSTAFSDAARQSIGELVKRIFGPLSRAGTIINSFARTTGGKVFKDYSSEILDALNADPARFVEIAERLVAVKNQGPKKSILRGLYRAAMDNYLTTDRYADDEEVRRVETTKAKLEQLVEELGED